MKLSHKVFLSFSSLQPSLAEEKVLPVKETVTSREGHRLPPRPHPTPTNPAALFTLVLENVSPWKGLLLKRPPCPSRVWRRPAARCVRLAGRARARGGRAAPARLSRTGREARRPAGPAPRVRCATHIHLQLQGGVLRYL